MDEIAVVVEGQTEEAFVNQIVAAHLRPFDVYIQPVIVATARAASGMKYKGGGNTWQYFRRTS